MIACILILLALLCAGVAFKGGLSTLARGRKYKSGTGWCIWRWTDVDSEYILRLHVLKTPWCAVCLHWIRKPDAEPWLHDHPVSFLSFILRGGYTELRRRVDGRLHHKVNRWFNIVRASRFDRHRIILTRANTLTLCLMGPKTREWGFHVWREINHTGWIGWKDYYARLRAGEDMRCFRIAMDTIEGAAAAADDRFHRTFTHEYKDEDVRLIDMAPADAFDAEAVTGELLSYDQE